jgi:hypothetical protein
VVAVVGMFVSLQGSFVEILVPNIMTVRGKAFGKYMDDGVRALMNGTGILLKEAQERLLTSSTMGEHRKKEPSVKYKIGPHLTLTVQ